DGCPGPLDPPGSGSGGSPDSPLALAYKRAAARLGAWPWDPAGWDDSYSNRFAHGDGWGHPTHAGIEGLQAWSGTIGPTGNAGTNTFNFLRSVKVPQGIPHAGEPALDSVCVQLINQAYAAANPPAPGTTVREAALELAVGELGQGEHPAGSNQCTYCDWYGMVGPWCAMFATWCYEHAGGSESFLRGERYAYVPYIVSDARNGRYGLSVASSPIPGDLVCYDWERNGGHDHGRLFEEWQDGAVIFSAIEGNTSTSNDSNGGQVMRRSRNVSSQGTVFVRVAGGPRSSRGRTSRCSRRWPRSARRWDTR